MLTEETLVRIAARARPLWDRLDENDATAAAPADEALIDARIEHWRQVLGDNDGTALQRRLAWDGIDLSAVRSALGSVRLENAHSLPAWAETFRGLIEIAYGDGDARPASDEAEDTSASIGPVRPFEDLLRPLVIVARNWLDARIEAPPPLSEQAFRDLEQSLLRRLTRLCAECLYARFTAFRATRTTSFGRLLARTASGSGSDVYRAFAEQMARDGMADFFSEYPSLARLVAIAVDQWLEMAAEFVARLASDWSALHREFHDSRDLGVVTSLLTDQSDYHDGGRSTFVLTFSSGLRLVYKPRNLGIEASWFSLLTWLNEHDALLPFRILNTVDRGEYGWVEYAEQRPCADQAEVRRYFARTGMLLCLVYAFGGSDCHFENIVASGEYPVLVDLETIMHPVARESGTAGSQLQRAIRRERQESVMRTGLLPRWVPQAGGRALETSGLGAVGPKQTAQPLPVYREANTDAMQLERDYLDLPAMTNEATIAGVSVSPNGYALEIEDGFRQMYRFLVAHRDEMLAASGPLTTLRDQHVRFIYRATSVYYAVADHANHPECLRDGVDRSIELDALSRTPLREPERPIQWPLNQAELLALEQDDIPHFLAVAKSDSLAAGSDRFIAHCFAEPCFESMRSRMRRLDDADLVRQTGVIRAAMRASVARHGQEIDDADDSALPVVATLPPPAALVEEAIAIAESIRRDAIGDPAEAVTWMTVRYVVSIQRYQFEISGDGLYDGGCGVALFLAALEHATGGAGFRDLAIASVAPLREALRDGNGDGLAREVGIGGSSGIGSLVYGLTRVAQLLGEASLLKDARRAAALVTPGRIADDRAYDVLAGAAGAILGLLALDVASEDADALDRAIACGDYLLEHREPDKAGRRAWPAREGIAMAGFAHGAAGIAYALLRLYGQTGDARFRTAAAEAIAFEDSLFSAEEGNWPDLRGWTPTQPEVNYALSWCNGGPGIGLARLGGLGGLDTPAVRADIDAAISLILRTAGTGPDHLCCGNLGRADILLEIGRRLSRPDLVRTAQTYVAGLRQRASGDHGYRMWWKRQAGVALPGMFQGTSGIGYTLLRAAYPEHLPSVLLWD